MRPFLKNYPAQIQLIRFYISKPLGFRIIRIDVIYTDPFEVIVRFFKFARWLWNSKG